MNAFMSAVSKYSRTAGSPTPKAMADISGEIREGDVAENFDFIFSKLFERFDQRYQKKETGYQEKYAASKAKHILVF